MLVLKSKFCLHHTLFHTCIANRQTNMNFLKLSAVPFLIQSVAIQFICVLLIQVISYSTSVYFQLLQWCHDLAVSLLSPSVSTIPSPCVSCLTSLSVAVCVFGWIMCGFGNVWLTRALRLPTCIGCDQSAHHSS